MLRLSFFTCQLSKRLVPKFTATKSVIGATGAKQKIQTSAKTPNNNNNILQPVNDTVAAATATEAVQAAAADALKVKSSDQMPDKQNNSATGFIKKIKKKKKRLEQNAADVETHRKASVPGVTSTNDVEKTSAPEAREEKKDERGDSPSEKEQWIQKKKKLTKMGGFREAFGRMAKEEPSVLARHHISGQSAEAQQVQEEQKQQLNQHQTPKLQEVKKATEEKRKLINVEPTTAVSPSVSTTNSAFTFTSTSSVVTEDKDNSSQRKTAMIKAFRIEDVLSACSPSDGVFARRLPQGGCQFFAWPGTPLAIASNAVATMPDTIRTVHAIFGRPKTPIDLVLDIDCPVPQEHWSTSKARLFQKKLLDDVLNVVVEEIKAIGEKIASQVVLQSPNLKKASFHVHTKLQDVAFEDYSSLHGFLYRFHNKIPSVDLQIYRQNGMLRMHRCMKENHTSAICVFDDKKWNIGFPNGVPDPIAALHSACIREAGTYSRLLYFDAPRSLVAHDGAENKSGASSTTGEAKGSYVLLPRTEREAVESVSNWLRTGSREADVAEWRSWIGLGINAYRVAYQFRDAQTLKRPAMEELLEAWVEASKKCPTKFRQGTCESKWASFDINRLCRSQEEDWWPSYLYIGRMAMRNEAVNVPTASSKPLRKE